MDYGASRPWAELNADILREITGRLRDSAGDYIRFLAVCRLWRAVAPETTPRFAPWLMERLCGLSDGIDFYSPFSRTRCYLPHASVLCDRKLQTTDLTGGRILTAGVFVDDFTASLVNPLTGDVTALPPFPRTLPDSSGRCCTVLTNGAVLVHRRDQMDSSVMSPPLQVFILEPGESRATELGTASSSSSSAVPPCACGALSGGATRVVNKMPPVKPGGDKYHLDRHMLEYQGEVLCADLFFSKEADVCIVPKDAFSVTVHVLDVAAGEEPRWVERQHGCVDEHVCMFLGYKGSFAMDARELGGGKLTGGCAYFVEFVKRTSEEEIIGVYRYSFKDCSTTVIDELPDVGWFHPKSMWFMPRPNIRISVIRHH